MWTEEARIEHAPRKARYPSDMTDVEWEMIALLIPPPRPGGRHRETDMREVNLSKDFRYFFHHARSKRFVITSIMIMSSRLVEPSDVHRPCAGERA
jgi:hypothetical protein